MNNPVLTIIAGCNGSGKSSFSHAFSSKETSPFDYDKVYLEKYDALKDSHLRESIAQNLANQTFENAIDRAIHIKSDFAYITNFNSKPLDLPKKFKSAGYRLRLVFFCLDSAKEAKRRVQIRVENGGHFVPPVDIRKGYHLGFRHLNEYWKKFNEIYLFDNSPYNKKPKFLLSIYNKKLDELINFPSYLYPLIPNIKHISRSLIKKTNLEA